MTKVPARGRAWATLIALVLLSLSCAMSCSSLIGTDDYADSASVICGMVSVCYGEDARCVERTRTRLDASSPSVRARWLQALSSASCLTGCTAARSCLDLIPMCNVRGACAKKEDCCGFLSGEAECESDRCCGAKGLPCKSDADCCPSVGCDRSYGTCGGVVCRKVGKPCVNPFDCCSGKCGEDGRCATACADDRFECRTNGDCCSGFCDPASDRCAPPPCIAEGGKCPPGGGGNCCSDPAPLGCKSADDGDYRCLGETTCLPPGTECTRSDVCCSQICKSGRCSKPCALDGAACSADQPCCEGDCVSGSCVRACVQQGQRCSQGADCCSDVCDLDAQSCSCSDELCTRDENCCTGKCYGGVCKPPCVPLDCGHSECELGGPLGTVDLTSGVVTPCPASGAQDPTCVAKVCNEAAGGDAYCCCGAWDALCVKLAIQLCGACQ